ncbi:hypothetical protein ACOI1H_13730 [Loktanella sp. DJP18]|uniref:hypothetical protein n=1 Tax=Loktanella sp. DJP18 TaxID=3409788 RepID=UPI003BB73A77
MQIDLTMIAITQNLETQDLEAYYGLNFLWATPPSEPGSCDEVVEFYTMTLIRLLDVVKGLSAHGQLTFMARSRGLLPAHDGDCQDGLLGRYPDAA